MSVPPQKFREIVFQMLYSRDLGRVTNEDMIPLLMEELTVSKVAVKEAQERAEKILEKLEEIDKIISKISTSYEFERIQSVERNVLRLGVFEMILDKNIPPKVAIAEAMRLTRKFGTPESASFVNAVLDQLYKASQGIKVDDSEIAKSLEHLKQSEETAKNAIDLEKEKNL